MIPRHRVLVGDERRSCRRVAEDLGIAVSVLAGPGATPALSSPAFHLTRDISEGGLRFCPDQALPPGTCLRVYVALRQPLTTLTHLAQVRWSRGSAEASAHEVGVEFTEAPDRDREIWSQYVRQRVEPDTGSN